MYVLSSPTYSLCILFILFCVSLKKKLTSLNIWISFSIVLYFLYVAHPYNYVIKYLQIHNINTTLQNGLLNIHPPLIYYTYINVFFIWLQNFSKLSNRTYIYNSSSVFYVFILVSLFGMVLGAVWASQELNWGGFWSWDPVEIVSLVTALIFIKSLHNQNNIFIHNSIMLYVTIFFSIYLIIRTSAVSTVHSFVRSANISPYFIFVTIIISLYVCIIILYKLNIIYYFYILGYHRNYLMHKGQTTLLFFYVTIYMILLVTPLKSPLSLLSLPDIIVVVILFSSSNVIFYSISTSPKLNVYILIIFIFVYITIAGTKAPIMKLIIFCVASSNIFLIYTSVHLLSGVIYLIFFVFLCNILFYNCKFEITKYNFTLNNIFITNGSATLYESSFFLKKKCFVTKLKNYIQHITGFNIISNNFNTIYVFVKNSILKILFGLDSVYVVVFLILYTLIFFIRVNYFFSTTYTKAHIIY